MYAIDETGWRSWIRDFESLDLLLPRRTSLDLLLKRDPGELYRIGLMGVLAKVSTDRNYGLPFTDIGWSCHSCVLLVQSPVSFSCKWQTSFLGCWVVTKVDLWSSVRANELKEDTFTKLFSTSSALFMLFLRENFFLSVATTPTETHLFVNSPEADLTTTFHPDLCFPVASAH